MRPDSPSPTFSSPSDSGLGERAGDRLGNYTLLHVIGEGGFAVVWMAQRLEPYHQRVAIKIMKPGFDSSVVLRRFEQERQAMAEMEHPGIARVLDGGLTQFGRPYFVMEYVPGSPITTYCDRAQLSIRDRLWLFIDVCRAVQHAHSKGIIHRDLKPSNVLVQAGVEDPGPSAESRGESAAPQSRPQTGTGFGNPRIIDFGVAKAVRQSDGPLGTSHEGLHATEAGLVVGTLEYMSPEQAVRPASVDTRSDVYALGVILYELLTGVLPVDPAKLRTKGIDEARRWLSQTPAPNPATRVGRLPTESRRGAARHRGLTSRRHLSALGGDLALILQSALAIRAEDRYQTPLALAEDIQRYLAGHALAAGPDSVIYRLSRWARRHRVAVLAGACLIVSLAGGLAATTSAMRRAKLAEADAIAAKEITATALVEARSSLYVANISAAAGLLKSGASIAATSRLERCDPADRWRWEWRYFRGLSDSSILVAGPMPTSLTGLKLSPDGRRALVTASSGESMLIDPITGGVLLKLPNLGSDQLTVAFSPDGGKVAVSGGRNGELRIYCARTAELLGEFQASRGGATSLLFTDDGKRLWVAGGARSLRLLDVSSMRILAQHPVAQARTMVLAPAAGGACTLMVDSLSEVMVLENRTGAILGKTNLDEPRLYSAAYNDEKQLLLVADVSGGCGLWRLTGLPGGDTSDSDTPKPLGPTKIASAADGDTAEVAQGGATSEGADDGRGGPVGDVPREKAADGQIPDRSLRIGGNRLTLQRHSGPGQRVALSPSGQYAITCGRDRVVRAYDTSTGTMIGVVSGGDADPTVITFDDRSSTVAISGSDGTTRIYNPSTMSLRTTLRGHMREVTGGEFLPQADLFVTSSNDSTVRLWHTDPPAEIVAPSRSGLAPPVPCFTGGGELLVGQATGRVDRFEPYAQRRIASDALHGEPLVAVTRYGQRGMVTASRDGVVRIWHDSDTLLGTLTLKTAGSIRLAVNSSGTTLAVMASSSILIVPLGGSTIEPRLSIDLPEGEKFAADVAFCDRDRMIAAGTSSGKLNLYRVSDGEPEGSLASYSNSVTGLTATADGQLIATAGIDKDSAVRTDTDRVIRVWSVASRTKVRELRGHTAGLRALAFVDGGTRLISGGKDASLRLWDVASGQELCVVASCDSAITGVTVSPDERLIAVGTVGGVRLLFSGSAAERLAFAALTKADLPAQIWEEMARSHDESTAPFADLSGGSRETFSGENGSGRPLIRALVAGGWFNSTRPTVVIDGAEAMAALPFGFAGLGDGGPMHPLGPGHGPWPGPGPGPGGPGRGPGPGHGTVPEGRPEFASGWTGHGPPPPPKSDRIADGNKARPRQADKPGQLVIPMQALTPARQVTKPAPPAGSRPPLSRYPESPASDSNE